MFFFLASVTNCGQKFWSKNVPNLVERNKKKSKWRHLLLLRYISHSTIF